MCELNFLPLRPGALEEGDMAEFREEGSINADGKARPRFCYIAVVCFVFFGPRRCNGKPAHFVPAQASYGLNTTRGDRRERGGVRPRFPTYVLMAFFDVFPLAVLKP